MELGLHPAFQTSLEEAFMEPVNGSASVPTPLKGPNNLLRNLLSSQRKIEAA